VAYGGTDRHGLELPLRHDVRALARMGCGPSRPEVLSGEEVSRLIACLSNIKHRTFLLTLCSAGLRLNEAAHVKIADIDSQRMQSRVACGKGAKERRVPLSPRLVVKLREYWKQYRSATYLFPERTRDVPLAPTTIQKVCNAAAMGASWHWCAACDTGIRIANSCGDRHCPQCRGATRAA
jgi:integrase